jgi:hypothetical protein
VPDFAKLPESVLNFLEDLEIIWQYLKVKVRTMDIYPIFGCTYKYAKVLSMEN